MTERGSSALRRDASELRIGPSAMRWNGNALEVSLDEIAVPWPARVRGHLRIEPRILTGESFALDAAGQHRWQPIAPRSRVTLALDAPSLAWSGEGYLDSNWGQAPLEDAFSSWHWSRSALPEGGSLIRYDLHRLDGSPHQLNLQVGTDGRIHSVAPRAVRALPDTFWGLRRRARGEARLLQTLEDGPFYARSLLTTRHQGQDLRTLHESLSLQRFRARWVQALLPFRMPRRAG